MAASNQTMLFEERTSALDERMDCVRQMIAKLSEHRGPAQSQQGMVADVREELKQIGLNFEHFGACIAPPAEAEIVLRSKSPSQRLRAEAERQGPKLQSALGERQKAIDDIKARFKRAIVKMERNRQLQAKSDREMLLVGAVSASELRKWRASTNENVANASHEVTNTLRETVRMMGTELEKSHANITSLKESSRMLSETKLRHEVLDSVMHLSHRLIAKLESADWVDRVLMLLAFVLFVGVVLTILVRRIWIPGLGLAFGFMRSLLFGGTPKVTGSALATTTSAAAAMSSITAITTVDAQPAGTAVAEPTAAASVATALNIDNL
ncbi:Protein transport protein sec20, partial [Spiromyces aspiralis]